MDVKPLLYLGDALGVATIKHQCLKKSLKLIYKMSVPRKQNLNVFGFIHLQFIIFSPKLYTILNKEKDNFTHKCMVIFTYM